LDMKIGCSPHTYKANVPLLDPISFYSLYIDKIVPSVVFDHTPSRSNRLFFITNNAAIRYNLYEGPIDINDLYTAFPFNDSFYITRNIYGSDLNNFLVALNSPRGQEAHAVTLKTKGRGGDAFVTLDNAAGDDTSVGVQFIWSDEEHAGVILNDVYDVVSHEYDAFTFAIVLKKMQLRNRDYVIEPYEEAMCPTNTQALARYIDEHMPCFSSTTALPAILAYLVGAILGVTVLMSLAVLYRRRRRKEQGDYSNRPSNTESDGGMVMGRVVGGQQHADFEPDYVEFKERSDST